MVFEGNVVTATASAGTGNPDSSTGALGRSVTGSIRSQSFLVAPELKPGGMQEVIHGTSAVKTSGGNIEVTILGDWVRHIQSYEHLTVGGDSTHEYDDSLYADFAAPGALENHYLNNDVEYYYLDGHHIWVDEPLTEHTGTGSGAEEVSLSTVRYGNDTITVDSWGHSDSTNIFGDQVRIHTGSSFEFTFTALALRLITGTHFETYGQWGDDHSGQLVKDHSLDKAALAAGLQSLSGSFGKGFEGLSPSDPARVPAWNMPSSAAWPQIKSLFFTGANVNLKMTLELTIASLRAAVGLFGGSFRAFHSFVAGWEPTLAGVKLGLDAIHANFTNLCGRIISTIGFGNPRAPVPTPPPLPALEAEVLGAESALGAASGALGAADTAVGEAEANLGVATQEVAAAQAQAEEAAAARAAIQAEAGQGGLLRRGLSLLGSIPARLQARSAISAAAQRLAAARLAEQAAADDLEQARLAQIAAREARAARQAELDLARARAGSPLVRGLLPAGATIPPLTNSPEGNAPPEHQRPQFRER